MPDQSVGFVYRQRLSSASTTFSTGWPGSGLALRMPRSALFAGLVVALCQVGKASGIVQESQVELADGSVALLGNDDFGLAAKFWVVLLVDFFTEDKHDQVGILLDGTRLAQIGKLGP